METGAKKGKPGRKPKAQKPRKEKNILGPQNEALAHQNPDRLNPPVTDAGTLPNLKWSFTDSHMRIEDGGWARQTTIRELHIASEIAGVNMRLEAGAIRELHFHKEAEWAYMLKGGGSYYGC